MLARSVAQEFLPPAVINRWCLFPIEDKIISCSVGLELLSYWSEFSCSPCQRALHFLNPTNLLQSLNLPLRR